MNTSSKIPPEFIKINWDAESVKGTIIGNQN